MVTHLLGLFALKSRYLSVNIHCSDKHVRRRLEIFLPQHESCMGLGTFNYYKVPGFSFPLLLPHQHISPLWLAVHALTTFMHYLIADYDESFAAVLSKLFIPQE